MSKESVRKFRAIQGEWLFEKILHHLNMTEEEFTQEYSDKLDDDPTCLTPVVVEMMRLRR